MQDSLDDYIRIAKNNQDESALSKGAQVTAQFKKECDIRAMKVVEFAIEGRLRPEIFNKCLPHITREHYQDIVEERAITKLCGYPVCGKKIPDMPKKQYYISTKDNKVYDITDRKNYCCNFCYKASLHIKKQIDNSPLWLRKFEGLPDFNFLHSSQGGLPGELIDQGIAKPALEPKFTSVSIFTEASLKDMVENEIRGNTLCKTEGTNYKKSYKFLKTTMQTISENAEQLEEEVTEEEINTEKRKGKLKRTDSNKHLTLKKLPSIDENEEKQETKVEESCGVTKTEVTPNPKKLKNKNKVQQKVDVESLIKKTVSEWISLETYIYLFGENRVKELLNEHKLSDYFELLHIRELERSQQQKYVEICRRLQMQEVADEKFDNSLIKSELKPIPDYKKLKEENKDIDLKVKCFYGGVLHEKEDPNFPSNKKKETKDKEEEPTSVLPLVDVNSQNAMRKKIFLNSINKAMHLLLQSLRVNSITSVISDIQSLVKTFKLKADNIVFKPIIWNYISIVLLNILSLKDSNIKKLLEERQSLDHIELVVSSLPSKFKFVTDVMSIVINIDNFVENYITANDL